MSLATVPPPAARRGAVRADNRPVILDAAARLFREKGYAVTSMRDIAAAVGMLAGSLYYHFASKDELLVAVYGEGVRRISAAVGVALARDLAPWPRLEAVCAAHLAALLEDSDYAQVVIRVRPDDAPAAAARLVALRDQYEGLFAQAIDKLPLIPRTDRRSLRLLLLGALNWSQTWYRSGHDAPEVIARQFVGLLRRQLEP
jgi:TetR/AcrR family transcriptional regulator, cholesterol catabolism regulator